MRPVSNLHSTNADPPPPRTSITLYLTLLASQHVNGTWKGKKKSWTIGQSSCLMVCTDIPSQCLCYPCETNSLFCTSHMECGFHVAMSAGPCAKHWEPHTAGRAMHAAPPQLQRWPQHADQWRACHRGDDIQAPAKKLLSNMRTDCRSKNDVIQTEV